MNGFLGFWNEESEWIYHRAIDFLRGFFQQQVVWQMAKNHYWHVAMRLDFRNIGICMVCTSISPFFFMCLIHLQFEKKSSRVTRACIDLFLPRTCKNLALACNKTWDDGRRRSMHAHVTLEEFLSICKWIEHIKKWIDWCENHTNVQ